MTRQCKEKLLTRLIHKYDADDIGSQLDCIHKKRCKELALVASLTS